MKNIKIILILFLLAGSCLVGGIVVKGFGFFSKQVNEALVVTQEELGPRALNVKYEWFKNAYAALDSKLSNIKAKEYQISMLTDEYKDVPRTEWPKDDRQIINKWNQELSGMKFSYNKLAAEYNAEMAKFHTAFVNAGKLPEGGSNNLPREVIIYMEN